MSFPVKITRLPLVVLWVLCTFGCNKHIESDVVVLAQVGDKIITVDDFRYNYEFGFPHLKKGPDRKRSYLEYMIKEKILACAGYRLGLNEADRVQRLEKELLEELLVEEFFKSEVHNKIRITDDEVHDAITKSKVKWKLRYWVEPNFDYANRIYQAMRKHGYSAVVDEILSSNPDGILKSEDFETDYLTFLDVPLELLAAIKDLPLGEISDPIEMNEMYFIFQIVDIRRESLLEDEYQTQADRYRNILFYRKVKNEAQSFVVDFMTPKNVVTNGNAFRKLADALYEWQNNDEKSTKEFIEVIQSTNDVESAIFHLKQYFSKTLVVFEGGQWTISDFLTRFDTSSIKADSKSKNEFRAELNQAIAIKVRNYFFIIEALARKFDQNSSVQDQLQKWRDKWVYKETKSHYILHLKITENHAREYFLRNKDKYKIRWEDNPTFEKFALQAKRDAYIDSAQVILTHNIDSLRAVFPVIINQGILDTIEVLDSQKSRWISVQVFKQSSNRMSQPIVDPAWGF